MIVYWLRSDDIFAVTYVQSKSNKRLSVFLLAVFAWNAEDEEVFKVVDVVVAGGFWIRPTFEEPGGGGGSKMPPAAPPELPLGRDTEVSVFFLNLNKL